jgi:hypothetical protein
MDGRQHRRALDGVPDIALRRVKVASSSFAGSCT